MDDHCFLADLAQGLKRLEMGHNPAGNRWFVMNPVTGRTLIAYEDPAEAHKDLETAGFRLDRDNGVTECWVRA
jgi:hypothetical protein